MEQALGKKPLEKDKGAVESKVKESKLASNPAPNLKKPVSAFRRATTASHIVKPLKERSKSVTAQAVKKIAQLPEKTPDQAAPVHHELRRSVNYLSSTTASRAKAASVAQIHKPTPTISVGKLVANAAGIKSEASLKSHRPKTMGNINNNNVIKDEEGSPKDKNSPAFRTTTTKGKSRSQAAIKSVTNTSTGRKTHVLRGIVKDVKGKNKDEDTEEETETLIETKPKEKMGSKGTNSPTGSSSAPAMDTGAMASKKKGKEKKGSIKVTMNKTSELRAALHRPSLKRSSGSKSDTGSKASRKSYRGSIGKEGRNKRRLRKRSSVSSNASVGSKEG